MYILLIYLTGAVHSVLAVPQLAKSSFTCAVPGQETEKTSPVRKKCQFSAERVLSLWIRSRVLNAGLLLFSKNWTILTLSY